ncbi:hypothetical protein BDA99DRAFT_58263 [Phascolomyces articulosus]|uniref:Uncharacterized protein n=1 Tax=Phascolomyces articulosus TaxID=60185 RepID=A0AAD5PE47_9FUNG|nr:hypothetical protein BDA99DRAFT_58263 [Phascolomyces articulosus]
MSNLVDSTSSPTTKVPVVEDHEETLETMQQRHRNEEQALQKKIMSLRKSAGSNKKKKKEVQSRINDMEYDLRVKHEKELRTLTGEEEVKKNCI